VALRAAIGVHPQVVPDLDPDERAIATDPARLAAAAAAAGAVAIGECGLDGGTGERPLQEEILRAHLRAARELGLPLVLHVLRAHDGAAAILRAEGVAAVGGIMHSYSGGAGLVPTYLALGLGISFAGAVTWPGARRPIEAARVVPDDHLMVETDAPDQTPAPHRGARCEPAHLAATVHALALVRGVDAEVVAAFTEANARRILGW
jgi:TatD DNase family protein